jgi:hypothetical protein
MANHSNTRLAEFDFCMGAHAGRRSNTDLQALSEDAPLRDLEASLNHFDPFAAPSSTSLLPLAAPAAPPPAKPGPLRKGTASRLGLRQTRSSGAALRASLTPGMCGPSECC